MNGCIIQILSLLSSYSFHFLMYVKITHNKNYEKKFNVAKIYIKKSKLLILKLIDSQLLIHSFK